ncbi:hypothetical protein JS518_00475 [Clostridiales bacterium FE2010]|nr:hypothetical protein JS518_00475 [Clostridiales bacterium FE2010]
MIPTEVLAEYLHQIVNPNSVYRFLLEVTDISVHRNQDSMKSTYYIYSIHPEIMKLFSIDLKTIEKYLKANPPSGYAEEFLRDLYIKLKDAQNNLDRGIEIQTTIKIEFNVIKQMYEEGDYDLF